MANYLSDIRGLGVVPPIDNHLPDSPADMWASIANDKLYPRLPQAQQQLAQQLPPLATTGPSGVDVIARRARELFLKRMGGLRGEMNVAPYDFVACHVAREVVYLFYCFRGCEGVTKENIDLFKVDYWDHPIPDNAGWYICYYANADDMLAKSAEETIGPYATRTQAMRMLAQENDKRDAIRKHPHANKPASIPTDDDDNDEAMHQVPGEETSERI
jgi:hypothetical protein